MSHEFSFTLPANTRLDFALVQCLPQHTRSKIQRWIREGRVKISDRVVTKAGFQSKREANGIICIPEEKTFELKPSHVKVPILYEDDFFAVIHKPPKMTVHPGAGTKGDTLVHSLIGQMDSLSNEHQERPGIVHRLDRETEGLLLIAKTNDAHAKISRLFAERKIRKTYYAFLFGTGLPAQGHLYGKIGRHPKDRKKMLFIPDSDKNRIEIPAYYKEASLTYSILQETQLFSFAKILLETGRTHQIRASFFSIGRPVVGDKIYALKKNGKKSDMPFSEDYGLLLLARKLEFIHPFTGKEFSCSLPFPKRFLQFAEKIGIEFSNSR
ncbi:MAG: RluA family pseudouridine synthase [Candidatus Hydrogenedentota bacterium]|nr:MAG: RluA family pseudouridine synthase [Candidatus Hydrogenedentota bacterium]